MAVTAVLTTVANNESTLVYEELNTNYHNDVIGGEIHDVLYLPPFFKVVLTTLYVLTLLCGLFGNTLTLVTLVVVRRLWTVSNIYIGNLALASLLLSIIGPTVYLSSMLFGHVDNTECELAAFFTLVAFCSTLGSLTLVAINRCILICAPRDRYGSVYKPKFVCLSVIGLWLLSVLTCLLPFWGVGRYGYDEQHGSCLLTEEDSSLLFVMSLTTFLILTCSFVTAYCYLRIYNAVQVSKNRVASATTIALCRAGNSLVVHRSTRRRQDDSNASGTSMSVRGTKKRRLSRFELNLLGMWCLLLVCFLPELFCQTISYFRQEKLIPHTWKQFIFWLTCLSSSVNFLLYGVNNKMYRSAYCEVLAKCGIRLGKKSTPRLRKLSRKRRFDRPRRSWLLKRRMTSLRTNTLQTSLSEKNADELAAEMPLIISCNHGNREGGSKFSTILEEGSQDIETEGSPHEKCNSTKDIHALFQASSVVPPERESSPDIPSEVTSADSTEERIHLVRAFKPSNYETFDCICHCHFGSSRYSLASKSSCTPGTTVTARDCYKISSV